MAKYVEFSGLNKPVMSNYEKVTYCAGQDRAS